MQRNSGESESDTFCLSFSLLQETRMPWLLYSKVSLFVTSCVSIYLTTPDTVLLRPTPMFGEERATCPSLTVGAGGYFQSRNEAKEKKSNIFLCSVLMPSRPQFLARPNAPAAILSSIESMFWVIRFHPSHRMFSRLRNNWTIIPTIPLGD